MFKRDFWSEMRGSLLELGHIGVMVRFSFGAGLVVVRHLDTEVFHGVRDGSVDAARLSRQGINVAMDLVFPCRS